MAVGRRRTFAAGIIRLFERTDKHNFQWFSRMDSWQGHLAKGLLFLTILAVGPLLPVVRWRIKLRVLMIGALSMLLILPIVIFVLVALSLGSTI